MEQVEYNLLYRWFVGLEMDEPAWDATVFTKNRERLLEGDVAHGCCLRGGTGAGAEFASEEHFTVDGTLMEAWANRNRFAPKDPPPAKGTGARGRKLLRDTHESTTDPEARLYKKSTAGEAKPSYLGHVIMENRNGLVVAACATQSSTTAEREAALAMLDEMKRAAGSAGGEPATHHAGGRQVISGANVYRGAAATQHRTARSGIRKAFAVLAELSEHGGTQRSRVRH